MKVLVACEESQRVCIEFRKIGHEAYSCDIVPCNGGHPEWHIHDDVCEWKMTDTKKLMPYETSCGNEDLYDNSYKYCPYCGKKIKVGVE